MADGEGDRGEQLVGDAEEREELVDAAQRVGDAGVEEVAPGADDEGAGDPDARLPVDPADRLPDVAEHVLEHEAADPGARVHRGQDEQRLEHDREVVPEGLHRGAAEAPRRRSPTCPRPASGAPPERATSVCSSTALAAAVQLVRGDGEAEARHRLRRRTRRSVPSRPGRGVHRVVQARVEDAGGDQRHDGDERLHQHGAVADQPDLGLLLDQLRRGAGGRPGRGSRTARRRRW